MDGCIESMGTIKSQQEPTYPRNKNEQILLNPGIEITIEDFELQENLLLDVDFKYSSLDFCFCLSGKIRRIFWDLNDEIIIGPGQVGVWFSPSSKSSVEYLPGQPIQRIIIRLEPRLLNTLLKDQIDVILTDLLGIADRFYPTISEMTASMRIAVNQILTCTYQGLSREIYLESKILELLAYVMRDLSSKKLTILSPEEKKQVYQAREFLIHNLEKPISLFELARQVGLNDYKLKVGFREVFGTTVFGYLRQERLERARQLLEEGKMSVTEVSYAVGYSSLSHFSKVFARQFGIKPSSFLAEIRKNLNER
jgi:AraC-like DNA-binding protein